MPYRYAYQTWDLIRNCEKSKTVEVEQEGGGRESKNEDVRQRLQTARIERRISVSDLAGMIECDADALAAFERGERLLPPETMRRLVEKMGVRVLTERGSLAPQEGLCRR